MKDFAERGISRQRLRCQSVVFEITQAVTAGWHWGWVGESLENGDVVDIRMHLFVKHSQSQIISSSKNPIYCHIFFKHLCGVFIQSAHKEQRKACSLEPHFSDCYTRRATRDLIKMQILVQETWRGPETLHFLRVPRWCWGFLSLTRVWGTRT